MRESDKLFGEIKPTEREKEAMMREFELNILLAAYLMHEITFEQYFQGLTKVAANDVKRLNRELKP